MSDPKTPPAKPAAKGGWKPNPDLLPTVPDGYKPVGEVRVISENAKTGVRVVFDSVRVWKEAAE